MSVIPPLTSRPQKWCSSPSAGDVSSDRIVCLQACCRFSSGPTLVFVQLYEGGGKEIFAKQRVWKYLRMFHVLSCLSIYEYLRYFPINVYDDVRIAHEMASSPWSRNRKESSTLIFYSPLVVDGFQICNPHLRIRTICSCFYCLDIPCQKYGYAQPNLRVWPGGSNQLLAENVVSRDFPCIL